MYDGCSRVAYSCSLVSRHTCPRPIYPSFYKTYILSWDDMAFVLEYIALAVNIHASKIQVKLSSLKRQVLREIEILWKQISPVNPVCQTTGPQFCWNKKSANTNWTFAQIQIFNFWEKIAMILTYVHFHIHKIFINILQGHFAILSFHQKLLTEFQGQISKKLSP